MKALVTLLITLVIISNASAADLFNCEGALEKLNQISVDAENRYSVDLKKQLAEIMVLKTPLLFNELHYQSLQQAIRKNEMSDKDIKKITSKSTPQKLDRVAGDTWLYITDFYTGTESADATKALAIKASPEDFSHLKRLVNQINRNPALKSAAQDLIRESAAPLLKIWFDTNAAKYRREFYEKLPGNLDARAKPESEEVSDDDLALAKRIMANKITLTTYYENEKPLISIQRHFGEDKSTTENTNLVDLLTKEYPLLWGSTFAKVFTQQLEFMGAITPKKFYKTFATYNGEDLKALSKSIWSRIESIYLLDQPIPEDATLKTLSQDQSDLFNKRAEHTQQTTEDYFQTRLLILAINKNVEIRKSTLALISENLKEASKLVIKMNAVENAAARAKGALRVDFDDNSTGISTMVGTLGVLLCGSIVGNAPHSTLHETLGATALGATPIFLNAGTRLGIGGYSKISGKIQGWLAKRQKAKILEKAKNSHGVSQEEE